MGQANPGGSQSLNHPLLHIQQNLTSWRFQEVVVFRGQNHGQSDQFGGAPSPAGTDPGSRFLLCPSSLSLSRVGLIQFGASVAIATKFPSTDWLNGR